MIHGHIRHTARGKLPSRPFKQALIKLSSVSSEKPASPTVKEIVGFLILSAKIQVPMAAISNSTLPSSVAGLNVQRLTNRVLAKNEWGFSHPNWEVNPEVSFIENAHLIHDLMAPKSETRQRGGLVEFEKHLHGVELCFQPQGPWSERDLEEAKSHLALSAAEVTLFSSSQFPLRLTLISSKKIDGKNMKLRGGKTRKGEDHVEVNFAISRQGWEAPSAFASGLKVLGLALLWPLSCFTYRPRLAAEKGEVEKHISYRVKAASSEE